MTEFSIERERDIYLTARECIDWCARDGDCVRWCILIGQLWTAIDRGECEQEQEAPTSRGARPCAGMVSSNSAPAPRPTLGRRRASAQDDTRGGSGSRMDRHTRRSVWRTGCAARARPVEAAPVLRQPRPRHACVGSSCRGVTWCSRPPVRKDTKMAARLWQGCTESRRE